MGKYYCDYCDIYLYVHLNPLPIVPYISLSS
jgi:hypothetical protein